MTRTELQSWLKAYRRAWEMRDPEGVVELFSEDATYRETPFVEPLRGRPAIKKYWANTVQSRQEQVKFGFEILAVFEETGIARWWASFVRIGSERQVRLDGIFLLTFDAQNLCRSLREWWVKQEVESK